MDEIGVWVTDQGFNLEHGFLSWDAESVFADKNSDDDYWWEVGYGVLELSGGLTLNGESPWMEREGTINSVVGSVQAERLKDLDAATVLLKGWEFDFASGDHHINVIGIRIVEVEYDPSLGRVEWKAEAEYRDKNSDDDFQWRYQWEVIGLEDGAVAALSDSGADEGNTHLDLGSEIPSGFSGYQHAAVLPTGWRLDFASEDHELKTVRLGVRNVQYDPEEGGIRWAVVLDYSDQEPGDDYSWRYELAAIAFKEGRFSTFWGGRQRDNGGSVSSQYSLWVR
jgi:hypothetical protein